MPGPNITPYVRKQIVCDNATTSPKIVLPWMLAHGVDTLRVTNELRALEVTAGTFTQEVRFRFASVLPSEPGAWQTPGTAITRTANGGSTDDVDVSATTNQMWVQAALFGKQSSGVGTGLSGFQAQTDGRSRILGIREVELNPYLNTSATAYYQVGDPFPALGLVSYMFAFTFIGLTDSVVVQPASRGYEGGDTVANAWSLIGSSHQETAANDTHNSGTITVSPGSISLAQAGFAVTAEQAGKIRVVVTGEFA